MPQDGRFVVAGTSGDIAAEGSPTLCELEDRVWARLGEVRPGDFYTQTDVDAAINEAQKRFAMEAPWSWLYAEYSDTVSAGATSYSLRPDVSLTRHLNFQMTRVGNSWPYRPLRRVDPAVGFRLRADYGTSQGPPEYFYLVSASEVDQDATSAVENRMVWVVRFIPVPEANYTLTFQYMRRPSKLEECADTADIPADYSEALVAWATGQLWLNELRYSSKAGEQFALYNAILDAAKRNEDNIVADDVVVWGGEEPRRHYGFDIRRNLPLTLG